MSQGRLIAFSCLIGVSGLALAGCSLPFGPKSPDLSKPQNKLDQAANATKMSVMLATGQTGTCTITNTADSTTGNSEISIKGKKMLMKGSDFGSFDQTVEQGKPVPSGAKKVGYVLNDGEYMYIWQESATTGMKMKIQPTPTPDKNAPAEKNDLAAQDSLAPNSQNPAGEFESDPKYRIDCKLGNVTDEMFTPPAQVKFMDFGQALSFPGADQQPTVSLPAGKKPANKLDLPEGVTIPELPADLPTDFSDDSGQ
jgi:hypothetical protein